MAYIILIDHEAFEIRFPTETDLVRKGELIETDFKDDDTIDTLDYYIIDMGYSCDPVIERYIKNNA